MPTHQLAASILDMYGIVVVRDIYSDAYEKRSSVSYCTFELVHLYLCICTGELSRTQCNITSVSLSPPESEAEDSNNISMAITTVCGVCVCVYICDRTIDVYKYPL